MCGIAGVLGVDSPAEGSSLVEKMNATITHRGPDGSGVWAMPRAAVGMRRLSIIDVEGGQQPIVSDDGVVIVFNGEIYNHDEIRARLRSRGMSFRTRSDTEVILQLYREGGLTALRELEGMFGICLVDSRSGEVHLVRDRVGIKPLYYHESAGRLWFGSEIKAVLAGMPGRPPVHEQSVWDYLSLRYVPSPSTIWEGIHKLPPAHYLSWNIATGSKRISRYWSWNFCAEDADPGRNYEREFEHAFMRAVENHFRNSDVPVGVLLSGGLDSSCVLAALAEMGHRDIRTFSIGFRDGRPWNELEYAREVASAIGAEHHEIEIGSGEFVEFLSDFAWYADEPLADLASVPLHYVSRLASGHVKVVVSGEGSDEILAGYDFDSVVRGYERMRRYLRRVPRPLFSMAAPFFREPRRRMLRNMGIEGWAGFLRAQPRFLSTPFPPAEKAALWRGSGGMRSTDDVVRTWYDGCNSDEALDKLQHVWCHDWLVEDLLMKADKMTMASSIELRVPFLTHPFIEWAQRLPLEWRVGSARDGWASKRILRHFARRRLPERIINRPKQGFPTPTLSWLGEKGQLADWARERVSSVHPALENWINVDALRSYLDRARSGDLRSARRAWEILILDNWCRRWL
ncbi:MAG: asparagine synthase (glutamine-hydrolyzing) [Gemmatimonadota bacterium]